MLFNGLFLSRLLSLSVSLPPGTAFTLLRNACQPPPLSLLSSGQAPLLPLLLLLPSSSSSTLRPDTPTSLPSASVDPALPLLVLLSAPPLHTPPARLRVAQGRRSRYWTRRCSRGTGWPKGRCQPAGCRHPPSILSWPTGSPPNQPQTDQLTQHRCHPGGQL